MNTWNILTQSLIHDLKVPLAVVDLVVHSLLTKRAATGPFSKAQLAVLKEIRHTTAKAKKLTNLLLDPPSSPTASALTRPISESSSAANQAKAFDLKHDAYNYRLGVLDDLKTILDRIKFLVLSFNKLNTSEAALPERDQKHPMNRVLRNAKAALKLTESAKAILASGRIELDPLDTVLSEVVTRALVEVFDLKSEPLSEELQRAHTLEDVASICMQNGVMLHVDSNLWLEKHRLDRERVNQVIVNLLLNAFKYRTERIDIAAYHQFGRLILSIKDDGKGLLNAGVTASARHSGVLDISQNTPVRGHGIGLMAVEAILQVLGGRLKVSSADGLGTMFTVDLP